MITEFSMPNSVRTTIMKLFAAKNQESEFTDAYATDGSCRIRADVRFSLSQLKDPTEEDRRLLETMRKEETKINSKRNARQVKVFECYKTILKECREWLLGKVVLYDDCTYIMVNSVDLYQDGGGTLMISGPGVDKNHWNICLSHREESIFDLHDLERDFLEYMAIMSRRFKMADFSDVMDVLTQKKAEFEQKFDQMLDRVRAFPPSKFPDPKPFHPEKWR